jgi:actin-related protein
MLENRADRLYYDDSPNAVVIDHGSGNYKAGIAGQEAPDFIFSNIIGTNDNLDTYIGDEAQIRRDVLTLKHPVDKGVVVDWDDMQKVWEYMYDKLNVVCQDHPVLLTEVPLNPHAIRERTIQYMFETFSVPAAYLSIKGVLSVYASGRCSALSVYIGDGVSHTLPVYEGYTTPKCILRQHLAGSNLTNYLTELLMERGHYFSTPAEHETIREIKEKLCYVALDYEKELQQTGLEKEYELPDKSVITVGNERFLCAEALFKPKLVGMEASGLGELVMESLNNGDIYMRRILSSNIVVAGGSSLFDGIGDRLQLEVSKLAPPLLQTKVIANPIRFHNAWIGGSILASLSTFQSMWITNEEYNESGPAIVHKKCSS